ncbi:MAG: hypothetical protein NTX49_10215 [Chlamydiae bacterium]|nr:hypothetical protein [Chlamydiota bacterium]
MSAISQPKFPNYGSINADLPTAVTVRDPLVSLEIVETETKICGVSRKVFFNIAGAAALSGAVLAGGAVALAYKQPGLGIVLIIGSAVIPYVYKRIAEDCPIFCCRPR